MRPAVGIEVHAQLNLLTKLFSKARSEYGRPPNALVTCFDAGHPGTLPQLNRRALQLATRAARALRCQRIEERVAFDRKHYFYADLPHGYQITQQRLYVEPPIVIETDPMFYIRPLAQFGQLHFVFDDRKRTLDLDRIQLEMDSGRSLQTNNLTLVDLNRAGQALIELVFGPTLSSGKETAEVVRELRDLLKFIGVCGGRMERGELRCDANVSVSTGESLGERIELKNLNSLRAISEAVDYEIERHAKLLDNGQKVRRETRSWDAEGKKTVVMREKELQSDYRFYADPNMFMVKNEMDTTPLLLPHDIRENLLKTFITLTPSQALYLQKNNLDSIFKPQSTDEEQPMVRLLTESPGHHHDLSSVTTAYASKRITLWSALDVLEGTKLLKDCPERINDIDDIRNQVINCINQAPSLSKQWKRKRSPFAQKKLLSLIRSNCQTRIDPDDAIIILNEIIN